MKNKKRIIIISGVFILIIILLTLSFILFNSFAPKKEINKPNNKKDDILDMLEQEEYKYIGKYIYESENQSN